MSTVLDILPPKSRKTMLKDFPALVDLNEDWRLTMLKNRFPYSTLVAELQTVPGVGPERAAAVFTMVEGSYFDIWVTFLNHLLYEPEILTKKPSPAALEKEYQKNWNQYLKTGKHDLLISKFDPSARIFTRPMLRDLRAWVLLWLDEEALQLARL